MKRDDYSQLSPAELANELEKTTKEFFEHRLNVKIGKEKKTHLVRAARKKVARLKTFLTKSAKTAA